VRSLFDATGGDDHLLLGLDLVGEEERMMAMYDNSISVAVAHNLYRVLSRELGSNFNKVNYKLVIKWVRGESEGRIEGYNVPTSRQQIIIPP